MTIDTQLNGEQKLSANYCNLQIDNLIIAIKPLK